MRRMLCVAAPALVIFCLTGSAMARTHLYARVKCVGLYCAIVTEPESRPAPRPATWRRGWSQAGPRRACRQAAAPGAMRR
jgi:hypothetical protein